MIIVDYLDFQISECFVIHTILINKTFCFPAMNKAKYKWLVINYITSYFGYIQERFLFFAIEVKEDFSNFSVEYNSVMCPFSDQLIVGVVRVVSNFTVYFIA